MTVRSDCGLNYRLRRGADLIRLTTDYKAACLVTQSVSDKPLLKRKGGGKSKFSVQILQ
jgi:hypothetical protein